MSILALSSGTIAALVVFAVLDIFAVVFGLGFLRQVRAQRAAAAAEPGVPAPTGLRKPVSRRDFFRRSLLSSLAMFGVAFGGGTLAFLWPNLKGGFGSVIDAGPLDDIRSQIQGEGQPVYNGTGRFYIVPWNGTPTPDADYATNQVSAEGIMPLYQRCVHLGCRVPFCASSKWFECPCHGSKYNQAGEYQLGPAPRGMDRFKITVEGGNVMVDTSQVILGPPRGTDTISEPPQGPFCVAAG
jgi:cytochrome b6-f complex iron-sulfur subunit